MGVAFFRQTNRNNNTVGKQSKKDSCSLREKNNKFKSKEKRWEKLDVKCISICFHRSNEEKLSCYWNWEKKLIYPRCHCSQSKKINVIPKIYNEGVNCMLMKWKKK